MQAGAPLAAQWLRLWAPSAGGSGSIPGQGTRCHMEKKKSTGFLQELAESNMTREMASDQQSRSHMTEWRNNGSFQNVVRRVV